MSGVVLRAPEEGDLPGILELLATCLGGERTAAFYRWKHLANPFGPSATLVAEAAGSIVGLRALMRWRWRLGAEEVFTARAVDTAIHPEHRRQGLFSRMTQRLVDKLAADGTRFIFNTPNRRSGAGYLKLGWRRVGRVSLLVRPRFPGRGGGREVGARARDLEALSSAAELLAHGGFDSLLGQVLAEPAGRYATARSSDYYRWRYRPPGLDYRALWEFGDDASAALFLRAGNRRGRREMKVCDLLLGGGDGAVALGAELLRRLAAAGAADYLLGIAATGSRERAAFRRAGFLPLPRSGPRLVVRMLGDDRAGGPAVTGLGAWALSLGDLELF